MSKTTVFICGIQADISSLLSSHFGKPVEVCKKKSGAPYLKGVKKHVSVSHKRKCLVVAVSSDKVGVDVEIIEKKPTVFKIAGKYFSEKVEKDDYRRFFELWTRKEAYGKLYEKGISKEILAIDLSADEFPVDDEKTISFNSYDFSDYIITCASMNPDVEFIVDKSSKIVK